MVSHHRLGCCGPLPACHLVYAHRYEAYELERVQLREGAVKHKTEVETLVQEHQAELSAVRAGYDAQLATAQNKAAELQQRLEDTENDLAAARVRVHLFAAAAVPTTCKVPVNSLLCFVMAIRCTLIAICWSMCLAQIEFVATLR